MGTWAAARKDAAESEGSSRQGAGLLGAWMGMGKKDDGVTQENLKASSRKSKQGRVDEDDDRNIRFTIGGQGKRMTKEDFLKEMQSKSRREVICESSMPTTSKDLARQEDSHDVSRHVFIDDKDIVSRQQEKDSGSVVRPESSVASPLVGASNVGIFPADAPSTQVPETAAEQRRREQAFKGVGEDSTRAVKPKQQQATTRETPAERRRRNATSSLASASQPRSTSSGGDGEPGMSEADPTVQTPAERRRREAALGLLGDSRGALEDEDIEDDITVRLPPPRPVALSGEEEPVRVGRRERGIRFAEEPIRGRRAQLENLRGYGRM